MDKEYPILFERFYNFYFKCFNKSLTPYNNNHGYEHFKKIEFELNIIIKFN